MLQDGLRVRRVAVSTMSPRLRSIHEDLRGLPRRTRTMPPAWNQTLEAKVREQSRRPESAADQDVERTSVGLADEQIDVAHRREPRIVVHQMRERCTFRARNGTPARAIASATSATTRARTVARVRAASASHGGDRGSGREPPGLSARRARARAAPCGAVPPRSPVRPTTHCRQRRLERLCDRRRSRAAHTATRTGTHVRQRRHQPRFRTYHEIVTEPLPLLTPC